MSISQDLRLKYFNEKRVRIFFDEDSMLLGLKPADKGYKLREERFRCKKLPSTIPNNRFSAEWSSEENMLIVDLNDII